MANDEPSIDVLFDNWEREIEYFAVTRDRLGPTVHALAAALREWQRTRLDPDGRVRLLRREYIQALNEMRANIDAWVRIRGAGAAVLELSPSLPSEHLPRFEELLHRFIEVEQDREEFDMDHADIRQLLLMYEEFEPA